MKLLRLRRVPARDPQEGAATPRRRDGRRAGMRHELWEGLLYVVKHPCSSAAGLWRPGTSNFFSNVAFSSSSCSRSGRCLSNGLIGVVFGLGSTGWLHRLRLAAAAPQARRGRRDDPRLAAAGPPLADRRADATQLAGAVSSRERMLGGFGAVVYNIQQVSLRQAITPERMQGRMNAVMRFLVWGPIPLGSLVGGAIATAFGVQDGDSSSAPWAASPHDPVHLLADPDAEGDARSTEEPLPLSPPASGACADRYLRHRRDRRGCGRRGRGRDRRGLTKSSR